MRKEGDGRQGLMGWAEVATNPDNYNSYVSLVYTYTSTGLDPCFIINNVNHPVKYEIVVQTRRVTPKISRIKPIR